MSARMRTITEVIEFLDQLPSLVRFQRRLGKLTLRAASAEIGIAPSTLMDIEQGRNYNVSSLMLILRWVNGDREQHDGAGGADHPAEERGQPRLDLVAGSGVEGDSGAA